MASDDVSLPGVVGAMSAEDPGLDEYEEYCVEGAVGDEECLVSRDGADDVEAEDACGDEGEDHRQEADQPLPLEHAVEVPVEGASIAVSRIPRAGAMLLWTGHRCLLGVGRIKPWSGVGVCALEKIFYYGGWCLACF